MPHFEPNTDSFIIKADEGFKATVSKSCQRLRWFKKSLLIYNFSVKLMWKVKTDGAALGKSEAIWAIVD